MDVETAMYAYISEPVEFRQLEGEPIDFRKTFDVRGLGTDEMLQLYMRKAHLPDEVEQMPAMQRRAYVYDIVRSHKGPGYWVVIANGKETTVEIIIRVILMIIVIVIIIIIIMIIIIVK